jgi:hypothetical protein
MKRRPRPGTNFVAARVSAQESAVPQKASVQPFHDEPPSLSADMTPTDLIDVLEHLPFRRGPVLIRVDRDVLVRALQAPRRGPSC